jgi:WD40 repeat protein
MSSSCRLWDVETGQELLLQDGHSKATYGLAFQNDGALVVTGEGTSLVDFMSRVIRSVKSPDISSFQRDTLAEASAAVGT